MPDQQSIAEAGAAACEQFVQDMIEIDRAFAAGRLHEWIEEKLADDRAAAGFDPATDAETDI